jgi:branched-chain amino acid transport system substrate-binding protein
MCLGAASCRQSEESQHKGDADSSTNLTVGVVLPLTGLLAEMGNTEKKAIELALSQKKIDGSRGLRVLFEDGKGDAKAVVAAANKLAGIDKVAMLITSTSGGSLAARPVAETFGIPLIAFCMDAEIAAKSPTTVRYYLGLEEESNAIVKYLLGLPADTKIAILHGAISAWVSAVNTIYRPRLSSHFSAPALIEEYDLKSRDFRSQLAKIKSANVRVLVILGYGFEYGPLFTQIEESGIRDSAEIVGDSSIPAWPLHSLRASKLQAQSTCLREAPKASSLMRNMKLGIADQQTSTLLSHMN